MTISPPRSNPRTHRNAKPLLQFSLQYVVYSVLQNVSSLTFWCPISVRLSHATAKTRPQPLTRKSPRQSARPSISGLSPPLVASRAQSLILRSQRINYRNELHLSLVAHITQLSNTRSSMVTTVRRAPIRINPASCLPLDFSHSDSIPCPPKPPHSYYA